MEQTGSNSYPPWRLETRHGWSGGHVMSPLHNLHCYAYMFGIRSTPYLDKQGSSSSSSSSTVEYKVDISSIRRNPIKTAINYACKPLSSKPQTDSLVGRRLLQNRPHHLITQLGRFGESRRKVCLNPLEPVPVGFKIAE